MKGLYRIMVRLKTQINSYLYLYSVRAIGLIPKISRLMTLDKNFQTSAIVALLRASQWRLSGDFKATLPLSINSPN